MFKSRASSMLMAPSGDLKLSAAITPLARLVGLWVRRARCRRELASLSPEQLRDVGLDPDMVRRESGKPFWRAECDADGLAGRARAHARRRLP
jgi:uncharacterized protein YjiS (DUF1127 family)